ncbi:MAG: MlaD family protein [candidate division WOR-3 bacterium]|nr:MlaD family protein [candidate division WOR-3 bacterium]MCX7947007.1 MlaD family protein [candidate division WOR-3 bacterium]MDW8149952.1 MlaD family protein [candidate division WOR-3 bacterium]
MEVNRLDYIKVGIFVLVMLVAFFIGYNWISTQKRQKHNYTYYIKLPRATLISPGTRVLVKGVPIGSVISVEIKENFVIVKFGLKDYRLRKNAYAQIISPSALGNRLIDIEPGNGEFLNMNDTIVGYDSPSFDEVMNIVLKLYDKVDTILSNVNNLVKSTNSEIIIISSELKTSLNNLNSLVYKVKYLVDNQNENLDSTWHNVNSLISAGRLTLNSIDSLIDKIKIEVDSIRYRGTVGKLTQSDSLYLELKSSIKKVQELIEDIKKNPSRYINVRIF